VRRTKVHVLDSGNRPLPSCDDGGVHFERGTVILNLFRCAVVTLMLLPVVSAAQDFDTGLYAYEAADYATALREWTPLAEQGDARAQVKIGSMHSWGRGVPRDVVEAMRWYRLAAQQGDADAQNNIGFMYNFGLGVPQDYVEAMRWYQLAAQQGNARAQSNIGSMHKNGNGVPQDYAEAVRWFRLAAQQDGRAFSQRIVGDTYTVMQDYAEAMRWYRLAAQQGDASAQVEIGNMYYDGLGVTQDDIAAHMWLSLAAANGESDRAVRRYWAADRMTPADMFEAQRRARLCVESGYQDCD
jgi:TPR repeat protein